MDEAPAMQHLSYEKDGLQTRNDVIQAENLETISNAAGAVTDTLNQHDYSVDLPVESMRLSADFPTKPERGTPVVGCNTTKVLADDTISGSENWEQKCCDHNGSFEKENFFTRRSRAQEPLFPEHRANESRNAREELNTDIAPGIREVPLQTDKQSRYDFMLCNHDAFNSNFAGNNNDNGCNVNYFDNNNDNFASNILTSAKSDMPSAAFFPAYKMPSGAQVPNISHNNDPITTGMNDYQDESGSNLKEVSTKEQSFEDSSRKPHDIRKISDRLETFNKNNEVSNVSIKILRPKIEETEMPTKGVVSNLKSLFESNAVNSNSVTCKSASYKLEYGVGRSSGTLNKGVFH